VELSNRQNGQASAVAVVGTDVRFGMTTVADFVPQKHLGSGASGVVRLVRRKADGRLYALKELEMPRASSEAATMLQESHILASIDHPFVIRYYDSFVELSRLYLVMEYAPNGSLYGLLAECKRTGYMDELLLWRYCIQILIGLHAIHSLCARSQPGSASNQMPLAQ
jgi:NIMA (never in mitosis gene a)-related kinase